MRVLDEDTAWVHVLQISGETLQCLRSIPANELRALIHWSSHVFYDRRNKKIESSALHTKGAARPSSLDVHGRRSILVSQNDEKNSTQPNCVRTLHSYPCTKDDRDNR